MDLSTPRVPTVNAQAGDRRSDTGAFARKRQEPPPKPREEPPPAPGGNANVPEIDPLLAELDRLRAIDPTLTESGLQRAVRAQKAYQHPVPPADGG